MLRFTCGEKKIKMSQNIMNMFVDLMMAKEGIYKNFKGTSLKPRKTAISNYIFSFIQFSII